MTTKLREPINVQAFFGLIFAHAFKRYCPICKNGPDGTVVDAGDLGDVIETALGKELAWAISTMEVDDDIFLVHIGPPVMRWAYSHDVECGGERSFMRPEHCCGLYTEITKDELQTWLIEALRSSSEFVPSNATCVASVTEIVKKYDRGSGIAHLAM